MSVNCFQKCRWTVFKNRVGELSCRWTVLFPVGPVRQPTNPSIAPRIDSACPNAASPPVRPPTHPSTHQSIPGSISNQSEGIFSHMLRHNVRLGAEVRYYYQRHIPTTNKSFEEEVVRTDHPMDQNVFAYVFGSLRRGAMCLPVICDCGIYWSYSLLFWSLIAPIVTTCQVSSRISSSVNSQFDRSECKNTDSKYM